METLDTTYRSDQQNSLLLRILNKYELADGTIIGTGFVRPEDEERFLDIEFMYGLKMKLIK